MFFQKIMSPILFQGNHADQKYFEGWYYKQVSKDGRAAISLIPGVSLAKGDYHCFVQYIYADLDEAAQETIKTGYLKYSLDQFVTIDSPFAIRIANNVFSESKMSVTLEDENLTVQGDLSLGSLRKIKKSLVMPNIMGFFAYFPKMECYHGVISMEHTLHGILKINGKETDFSGGKGYLEKDWGTSFPTRYIWVQCNHFKRENACLFCSVADIPFLNKTFRGFICCLIADGDEYRFATYNRSILKVERLTGEELSLLFEHGKTKLRVEAKMKNTGTLIAPKLGKMQEIIKEELFGEVKFTLYNRQNTVIYEDAGNMAGIEVSGLSEKEGSVIWRKKC